MILLSQQVSGFSLGNRCLDIVLENRCRENSCLDMVPGNRCWETVVWKWFKEIGFGKEVSETDVLIPFGNRCQETGVFNSIVWKQMSFALRKLMLLGFTYPKSEGNYGTLNQCSVNMCLDESVWEMLVWVTGEPHLLCSIF